MRIANFNYCKVDWKFLFLILAINLSYKILLFLNSVAYCNMQYNYALIVDMYLLQINNNGVISFERPFNTIKPLKFPANISLIAALWTDPTARRTGRVFYRHSTDKALLDRASKEIQNAYLMPFSPTSMFIVSWNVADNVNQRSLRVCNSMCILQTKVNYNL